MKTRKITAVLGLASLLFGCATAPENPETPESAVQGYSALAAGDLQTAEVNLNRALAEQPGDPNIQLNLGEVYQQSHRPEKARDMYLEVLRSEPRSGEEATGVTNRAREHLKELYLAELAQMEVVEPAESPKTVQPAEPEPFPYWVQIGYFSSPANAEHHWQAFSTKFPEIAESRQVHFLELDGGSKVRLGPYESLNAAARVCRSLRRAGEDCFPGETLP